ncbi:uncharacterized protein akna isoform X2 [Vanacampus margaritifer]
METVKNTKTGALSWTPAPIFVSPTTSEDDEWDEEEEQDDDFSGQMDENGIIGLTLVDEMQELDGNAELNRILSAGPSSPEDLSGCEVQDLPPEEISYIFNEELDDADVLSTFSDDISILKEQRHNVDEANKMKTSKAEHFSERGTHSDMAQGERAGAEVEADGDCKPQCPTYQTSSGPTIPIFTHLCHFTLEEMAAAGITCKTIPDFTGFTDSPPDSNSLKSCVPTLHHQGISEHKELEEDAVSPQPLTANRHSGRPIENTKTGPKNPTRLPARRSQPCQTAALSRTSSHNKPKEECCHTPRRSNESRKAYPSHCVPDLSKVKPRVSFPKGDYKPPKSRWSSKNPPKSLTPEAPVVFKSPADIVKEVLLNTTDRPQPPFNFHRRASTGGPNGTVPQEFRSQQKAGILLDQLQEDHGRLLTKYAEAANTIDRLRLEAKVNLYSQQPEPVHVMPLEVHVEPSKFIQLDFPQAQKAQPSLVSPQPSGANTQLRASSGLRLSASISKSWEHQGSPKLANALYSQADKFLQQLQHFEDLLKSKTPFQEAKGLAQLYQELDSLEKGYLSARKEHKDQQQQGAEQGEFDPNRELEEFIYQCGRHMDELKERVDQKSRDADSAYSLCPQAQKSSASDDSHLQTVKTPLLLDSEELTKKEDGLVNLNSSDFNTPCAEQAADVNKSSTVHLTHAPHSRRRKEMRKSYSSSQSSLAEISTSEKRSAKPQTAIRRVLSQDGVISPGTDSGFVGSDYSHQIWDSTHRSCHYRASKRASGPAEVSSVKPQMIRTSTPSRDSSQSHKRTSVEPSEYFQQAVRRSALRERKQRQWVNHTDSTRTDSESTHTVSEDIQGDDYEETLPRSSPSSSSSAVRHRHGDSRKTLRSSQVVIHNDSSQALQSTTPKHTGETNPLTVTNSSQGNCTHHRTSHPLRSQEHISNVSGSSRKKWTIDGNEVEKVVRRAARKRNTHKQQTPDTSTATEDENSACRLLVSRSTQTSIATDDSQPSHTRAQVQHIKRDHTECADGNDGRTSGVLPCSQCLSHHKVSSEKAAAGNRELAQLCSCHCHHCRHCGHSDAKTSNEQECCRDSNTPRISSCTPTESPSVAAPPAMCPTPLLFYLQPQPVHVYTNNSGSPSKVSSSKEEERSRTSPCIVPQRSLDDALLAAREINVKSKRMVRSLTAELRSLERLSKSCSNSD